jgi:hypothetical protein
VPQAAPGRLPREHGQVEVRQGQPLGDVRAQLLGDRVDGLLLTVHRPVRRLDALRQLGEGLGVGCHVEQFGPGEAGEGGDAVVDEQLPLVVADHQRQVGAGGRQGGGQCPDRRLRPLVLALPDAGLQLPGDPRVRARQGLLVRVVPGVLAEQRLPLVPRGVIRPHIDPGTELGRMRRGNANNDVCHVPAPLLEILRSGASVLAVFGLGRPVCSVAFTLGTGHYPVNTCYALMKKMCGTDNSAPARLCHRTAPDSEIKPPP